MHRSIPRVRSRRCKAIACFSAATRFMNLGDIQMPMARSGVVTTLSSSLASTKIVNIGRPHRHHHWRSFDRRHRKARRIAGNGSAGLELCHGFERKETPFRNGRIIQSSRRCSLRSPPSTASRQNSFYGEGTTLHLTGEIRLQGHVPVQIETTFAPGDSLSPDGMPIALAIQKFSADCSPTITRSRPSST